tara:strand:- start:56 stop:250 length:195 start_codon:yes stop_codon:yes gene_type:complete
MQTEIISISELKPMMSGAGWYVGQTCMVKDMETGEEWEEPYDRQSYYVDTEEEAKRIFKLINPA